MFRALCSRRNIRIKYERFANALTAAAVYNVNRVSADTPIVHAIEFVREPDPAKEEVKRIKASINGTIGSMPMSTSREKFMEIRARMIADLVSHGRKDAESIFDECFPSLKPTQKE
jgi:hypothetical protein